MGGALGLRAARCEPFGRGLSGAAREQPATVGVGPARTGGGVLWGPRGTRTANGRGVRPLGSGTRLEPSSADRPHLGWAYVRDGSSGGEPKIAAHPEMHPRLVALVSDLPRYSAHVPL